MTGSAAARSSQTRGPAIRNEQLSVTSQQLPHPKAMPSRKKPTSKEGSSPAINAIKASRPGSSADCGRKVSAKSWHSSGFDTDRIPIGENLYLGGDAFDGDLQKIHDSLISFAKEAASIITNASPKTSEVKTKVTAVDLVTQMDRDVEVLIKRRLRDKFPSYKFLGEETTNTGDKLGNEPTFVCDPIDGTTNFVHGNPYVSISLGFCYKREPLVGVVYSPFTSELFTGIKGKGSYRTTPTWGRQKLPIREPEPMEHLDNMLIMVEWGRDREGPNFHCKSNTINNLVKSKNLGGAMCHSCRTHGGAALNMCAVATGGIDMYWEGGVYAWDLCAGWIILLEAGGKIADANPGRYDIAVDNRMLLAVRPAPDGRGQKEIVQQFWRFVAGRLDYQS